jgi:hypothetical protein
VIGPPVIAQYAAPATLPTAAPRVINIGSNQMLIERPVATPKAVVILIPGGTTNIYINSQGFVGDRVSFTVRARDWFVQSGYATALLTNTDIIPDAIAQTKDIAGPVYLVGTTNAGGPMLNYMFNKKPDPRVAGLVFAPAASQAGPEGDFSVTNYPLKKLNVPVLLVQNRQDTCRMSTSNNAVSLPSYFANATLLWENSFSTAGPNCGGMSPHGFLGIEYQTVRGITKWMASIGK